MKKRFFCLALLGALLCNLAACGSSTSSMATDTTASADSGYTSGFTSEKSESYEAAPEAVPEANGSSAFAATRQNAKLILTADLSVEATDFPAAISTIETLTADAGGYIESSEQYGNTGSRTASYTVRIPQVQFESFLSRIGDNCHVVRRSQSAEDVADQYADLENRLATLQSKHDRLLKLLDQASTMSDIIDLETALSDTEYEINSISGTLKSYDSLVDFSSVSLSVMERSSLSAATEDNTFGARFASAVASGWHGAIAFLQGLLLTLAILWPLLLICVVIGLIIWRVCRAAKRRRAQNRAAQPPQDSKPDDKTKPQ